MLEVNDVGEMVVNGTVSILNTNNKIEIGAIADYPLTSVTGYSDIDWKGYQNIALRSRGTEGVPSAIQAEDGILTIGARGYMSTDFSASDNAFIKIKAAGTFTDASAPTYMSFGTGEAGSPAAIERMRISEAGYVGLGTGAPDSRLHIKSSGNTDATHALKIDDSVSNTLFSIRDDGTVESRSMSFKTSPYTAQKNFVVEFANAVANQKADLYIPSGPFHGYIRVTLTAGYNGINASGSITKDFYVGFSSASTIYTNESRYVNEGGKTSERFAIGEFVWDAANSRFEIPIVSTSSVGNTVNINVQAYGSMGVETQTDKIMEMNMSAIYTTDVTVYDRPYIHFNNYIGLGTTTPKVALDIAGQVRMTKNTAAPFICDTDRDAAIAVTSLYKMCVCNGTSWISINDGTACIWQ